MEKAIFAAGCFWGVEEAFRTHSGVKETSVGYSGGKTSNPTYKEVCTDSTGHAEVVEVKFDPSEVSYEDLVRTFFSIHNPMQLNRQGPDVGTQYRSAIFFTNPEQKEIAEKVKSELDTSGKFPRPIVTQIVEEQPYWMAEDYHQKYNFKRGLPSCHI